MNWSEPIDIYCERIGPAFWAEPVNALTNIAFLIAALAACARYRRARLIDVWLLSLIVIVALIAFGSFAFHTIATRGAVLLDTIPIALFVYGYLALTLRRFVGVPAIATAVILIAFIALSQGMSSFVPRGTLNGSLDYAPPLVALYIVGVLARPEARRGILLAAVVFTLSLALRTIDIAVCSSFPLGTHFAWHLINALVLYVLLITAIDTAAAARGVSVTTR